MSRLVTCDHDHNCCVTCSGMYQQLTHPHSHHHLYQNPQNSRQKQKEEACGRTYFPKELVKSSHTSLISCDERWHWAQRTSVWQVLTCPWMKMLMDTPGVLFSLRSLPGCWAVAQRRWEYMVLILLSWSYPPTLFLKYVICHFIIRLNGSCCNLIVVPTAETVFMHVFDLFFAIG